MSRSYMCASPPTNENSLTSLNLNHRKLINANNRHKTLSYEDLLIGKYLDQVQQQIRPPSSSRHNKTSGRNVKRLELESPYLQKLSHSNLLQSILQTNSQQTKQNSNRSFRANSAMAAPVTAHRSNVDNIEKYEPYFRTLNGQSRTPNGNNVLNINLKQLTDERDETMNESKSNMESLHLSLRRERPSSAPVRRTNSFRHNSKNRNNFRRQPHMLRALAYRNGSRQYSANIAAKSIIEFLEIATDRLQFTRAARRIFLENGDEIKDERQFLKNAVVYVSCGEEFSDPFLKTKEMIDKRKSALWTSSGVQFYERKPEKTPEQEKEEREEHGEFRDHYNTFYNKHNLPKPKNDRLTRNTRLTKRLVVYENGCEYNPTIAVFEYTNPAAIAHLQPGELEKLESGYLDDFLEECTNRLKISGLIKCVYNWHGKLVETLNDVPKLDKCLQSLVNEVEYAPVWVSKGEGFNPRGALVFMENLIRFTKINRKALLKEKNKLTRNINNLKNEKPVKSTTPIRLIELGERLKYCEQNINDLSASIDNLDLIRKELNAMNDQTKALGHQSLFKHIKSLETSEKIFGGLASKGLKLKCVLNGTDYEFEVFFNVKDWSTSNEASENQRSQMYQLLSDINRAINKVSEYRSVKITRLFNENGEEIKSINKLGNNDKLWVSQGENWKEERDITMAVSLNLQLLYSTISYRQLVEKNLLKDDEEAQDDTNGDIFNELTSQQSEQELTNFFKQKTYKSSSSLSKRSANNNSNLKKRNSFDLSSFNEDGSRLRIFIQALNINQLKKYDKQEYWEVLDESECLNALKYSSYEHEDGIVKDDHVELDTAKSNQLIIQNINEGKLLLYPRLFVNEKMRKNNVQNKLESVWLQDFQVWKFNKSGFIYNQFFPKICLTLNTSISIQLEFHFKKPQSKNRLRNSQDFEQQPQSIVKKGYAVILSKRRNSKDNQNFHQQWSFNKYGNICSKALKDNQMVLTSSLLLKKELNSLSQSNGSSILEKFDLQVLDVNSSFTDLNTDEFSLILMEAFDRQATPTLASSQRWAIKQENSRSIGEWRYSELSSAIWHKLALTWPVNEKEELIDKFKWPINGYLIPGAPLLKNVEAQGDSSRTRLKVLKNGQLDVSQAQTISRMDPKHLMKEYIHCTKITYRKFEFNVFLDTVTSALSLPNAARRIFDQEGLEHFDLSNLEQNQLIYVSMGEAWIHPKQVKEEQEIKILLTNLTEDLTKIIYFINLKMCDNFVIESSQMPIQEGAKIVLGACCLSLKQIERIKQGESIQHVIEIDEKDELLIEEQVQKKAHQISHENTDAQYAKKFKWPWEVVVNKSMEVLFDKKSSDNESDQEKSEKVETKKLKDSLTYSNKSLDLERLKPKPRKPAKNVKLNGQKFAFNKSTGQIYSMDNPNFVLAVSDLDNNLNEVFLTKRNDESLNQKWILKENGIIFSKTKPNMVLSVRLPKVENLNVDLTTRDEEKINALLKNKSFNNEASIVLLPYIENDYGNAHQKWFIDESIGFVYAFATSEYKNIEIMAANKANICTYYISYDKELSQPGYVCEFEYETKAVIGNTENLNESQPPLIKKVQKLLICASCAHSVKGKFKVVKLTKNQSFICHIGKSKEKQLKQYDGFKYLHDKVDLSFSEVESSFMKWLAKLNSWRQEVSAKSVLNELSAAKSITMVKLFAYKNGDGRLKPGELLVGSSIQGLLDQATNKLQLRGAARKFYTEEGNLILDLQDLIDWALGYYKKEINKKDESTHESKRSSIKSTKQVKMDISNLRKNSTLFKSSYSSNNLLDKVDFGENRSIKSSIDINPYKEPVHQVVENNQFKKQFTGPNKNEIKKLLNEYERSARMDPKKILKWPLEIWVSCGEPFVSPKIVTENENMKIYQREQIQKAEHELEKQTHALRQMIGRRLNSMNTGVYKSIKNPEYPVVREGHWTEVPYEEQLKLDEVNQLKNFVNEMRNPSGKTRIEKSKSLALFGSHQITKRIKVYINGQSSENAQFCWAASIQELNEAVKLKFRLNKAVKFFYTEDGKIISRFEDIVRDQLVCVSTGREFIPQEALNKDIQIKAEWSRVRKEEGLRATNIRVNSKPNPVVDVDPFGPPLLTASKQQITSSSTSAPLALLPPPPRTNSSVKNETTKLQTSQSSSNVKEQNFSFNKSKTQTTTHSILLNANRKSVGDDEDNYDRREKTIELLKKLKTKTTKKTKPKKKKKSLSRSPKRVQIRNGKSKDSLNDNEEFDDNDDDEQVVIANQKQLNSSSSDDDDDEEDYNEETFRNEGVNEQNETNKSKIVNISENSLFKSETFFNTALN